MGDRSCEPSYEIDCMKLLYLITEDWFFCSHFIERAMAARAAGYDVIVVTRVVEKSPKIVSAGLKLIHLPLARRSLNPFSAVWSMLRLTQIYWRERPDLVHHIAMKPIFLGTLAARLVGIHRIVNAPVGMGFVYTSKGLLAKVLRPLFWVLMHTLLNPRGSKVILENADDCAALVKNHHVREHDICLIRGAGVDIDKFKPDKRMHDGIIVMLVARLLWDKGVGEFVEAARLLRIKNPQVRFVLVGSPDSQNPANIPGEQLQKWHAQGDVEFWGYQENMPKVWAQADIACLPSYREGLPKSLIEALASGLPCVTTDVPGCREVVAPKLNGLLVPAREVEPLVRALQSLIDDPTLREEMGCHGRQRAVAEFSSARVIAETLSVYQPMLDEAKASETLQ